MRRGKQGGIPVLLPVLVMLAFGGRARAESQAPSAAIPTCPGLTIVTAISRPEGDYESIKTVTGVGGRP